MKENAFAIGLGVGTLLIGGGLVALGVMKGGEYTEHLDRYDTAKAEVEEFARVRPFPNEENQDDTKKLTTAFRGKVEGLKNALVNFRPESLEDISENEFQNRMVKANGEVVAAFDEKGIEYPEQFAMGFEDYKDALPNPKAAAKLDYQLKAITWLFQKLAEVEAFSVRNVKREVLPSEKGGDWIEALNLEPRDPDPIAQSMPIELVFLAEEGAVREFINALATSNQYFFAVDSIRIKNEFTTPPTWDMAGFEEEEVEDSGGDEGGFSGFEAFDFGDAEDEGAEEAAEVVAEEESADTSQMLGQVLGDEALYVSLQLRLMLFVESVEIPELK